MPAIPCPVSSEPGEKGQEGSGRLVNAYAEKVSLGGPHPVIWKRTPGLRQVLDNTTHNHLRGGIQVASTLIGVWDNRVHTVTLTGSTFSSTNRGALSGTDKVTVAKNNAATPNIACVSEAGVFNLYTGSAPDAFADADVGSPNSVSSHHGYLLFTAGDGTIDATGLNSVSIASNSNTQEQNVGELLRGIEFEDEWFACGDKAIGVYYDAATSPFPLARRAQIDSGIAGTHAIAASDELIWAAKDGTVRKKSGYEAVIISTPDVSRDVYAAIATGSAEDLEAETYSFGNNSIWALTLPGEWTWEYNITTQNWNERVSYGRSDWRASTIVKAFDRYLAGDRTTSVLFQIDSSYHREASNPLVWEMTTGVVTNFPSRLGAPRADFNFTAGVGQAAGEDPIQTDPSVLISVSRDGGHSFGNPVARSLGAQGVSNQAVSVHRCGLSTGKGWRFRLQVSDPVHVGFVGGQLAAQQMAA
jgi:hypothetical protein